MEMVSRDIDADVRCISLTGRLDAPGADRIDLAFTAATVAWGRQVLVDLSAVGFIASMGIRLLIASARGLHAKGGQMVLFGAQPLVYTVLDQAALDQIIPLVGTEQEALARLAS